MASRVGGTLNQVVRVIVPAAELISNPRSFVGVAISNSTDQQTLIAGISYSTFIQNAADQPNVIEELFVIRSLFVMPNSIFPDQAIFEEMLFYLVIEAINNTKFSDMYTFPSPLILLPGNSYSVVLTVTPRGAVVGNVFISIGVVGTQANVNQQPFPYIQR